MFASGGLHSAGCGVTMFQHGAEPRSARSFPGSQEMETNPGDVKPGDVNQQPGSFYKHSLYERNQMSTFQAYWPKKEIWREDRFVQHYCIVKEAQKGVSSILYIQHLSFLACNGTFSSWTKAQRLEFQSQFVHFPPMFTRSLLNHLKLALCCQALKEIPFI